MSNYCECHITDKCEWCNITKQNKRYREALKETNDELASLFVDIPTFDKRNKIQTIKSRLFDTSFIIQKALEAENNEIN